MKIDQKNLTENLKKNITKKIQYLEDLKNSGSSDLHEKASVCNNLLVEITTLLTELPEVIKDFKNKNEYFRLQTEANIMTKIDELESAIQESDQVDQLHQSSRILLNANRHILCLDINVEKIKKLVYDLLDFFVNKMLVHPLDESNQVAYEELSKALVDLVALIPLAGTVAALDSILNKRPKAIKTTATELINLANFIELLAFYKSYLDKLLTTIKTTPPNKFIINLDA